MPPLALPLEVGDVLFYTPSDLVGVLIALKTWTWLSHVEVYDGEDRVIAARLSGVSRYPVRTDHLVAIRRPAAYGAFQQEKARAAVENLLGKPYEVWAFESFINPWCRHRHVSRICSAVVTLYLRGGGVELFNPEVSQNKISPAQLWQTNDLVRVWGVKKIRSC